MNKLNGLSGLVLVFACAAAQGPARVVAQTFPTPPRVAMSRADQQSLGNQAAAQVAQQMPVLSDNSPETHYVQQLGNKLAAAIPSETAWPFDFHVLAQKDVNALALPGGHIFISVGTLTSAANEAVLAGVMAHEMAHVYMQHSARHAGAANAAGGLSAQLAQMGIHSLANGMVVNYTKSDELQADYVGTMILYKAGYKPQAMAVFFETLEAQGGSAPAAFLSSHPAPDDRGQAIHHAISAWPAKTYSGDSPEFAQVRLHAMGVRAYSADEIAQGAQSGQGAQASQSAGPVAAAAPNQNTAAAQNQGPTPVQNQSPPPAQSQSPPAAQSQNSPEATPAPADSAASAGGGPSLDSVAPSHNMIPADLGLMKMHRPDNWPVKMPQRQGQFVIVAPPAGMVGDNVGYGMLVGGFAARQVQGLGIDQVTSHLVQQFQKSNGLAPMGDAKPITVSGREGRSAMFKSSSPFAGADGNPLPERDWLVTVPQSDGGVIFMVFVAPEATFNRLKLSYNAMVESSEIK